jgi:VanZ family protein
MRIIITLVYFITCCVLFFLPGKSLPSENWLDLVFFDKWVHIGLFAVLAVLLCWTNFLRQKNGRLVFCLLAYGLTVEIIQGLWIPNRSFDLFDLASDSLGAAVGILAWKR